MNWFEKNGMKLSSKLMLSFALVIFVGLVQGAYSWVNLRELAQDVGSLTDDSMPKIDQLGKLKDNANVIASSIRYMSLLQDARAVAEEGGRLDAAIAKSDADLRKLSDLTHDERGTSSVRAIKEARESFIAGVRKGAELIAGNDKAGIDTYLTKEVRPLRLRYFQALDDAIESQEARAAELGKQAHAKVTTAAWLIALIGLGSGLIGSAAAWAISRLLGRQLGGEPGDVVRVANAIAEGNLTTRFQVGAGDTISIVAAMRRMNDNLAGIVGQVRNSSDSIATGSSQIAAGNMDLSQRTEEQASNLQETVASMEQMSGAVNASADTARHANDMMERASEAAAAGGKAMNSVVSTMQDIATSSKTIVDIIAVIDGIAFQTNILALNAAVEAARAGEQGRGFAVVAGEVRSLAGRAADAAKEIKLLIGASAEKVKAGSDQVSRAGASMEAIVAQIRSVSQLIGEMSTSTAEQSMGIGQVSEAMTQLDRATQQNAALVEESAAAAESLKNQAAQLASVVSIFRIDAH
jgi:methyl-accepting chemotaxis protein